MRDIPQKAIEFIKKWEGCYLQVYHDVAGYPTIAYGHLVKEGEDFSDGITQEQAEALLRADLAEANNVIDDLIEVGLNDNQFSALLSFTFNLGANNLKKSTLRYKLNKGEPKEEVANEFLKWVYAGGQVVKGLVRRRNAERELFLA
jgi:lysozyme